MISFGAFAGTALFEAYRASLRAPSAALPHLLGVLGDPVLADALLRLRDRRFLELVFREERVEEWARFSEHEVRRAAGGPPTGWGEPAVAGLAGALRRWASQPATDPGVAWVNRRAREVGVAGLDDALQLRVARDGLRAALWGAWSGGAR